MKRGLVRKFWIGATLLIIVLTAFAAGRNLIHAFKIRSQIRVLEREKRSTRRRSHATVRLSNNSNRTISSNNTPASTSTCSARARRSISSNNKIGGGGHYKATISHFTPPLFQSPIIKEGLAPKTGGGGSAANASTVSHARRLGNPTGRKVRYSYLL